ncbi:MAG TPA: hypothetical protein DCW31_03945 [Lactobacillus sp.]|nr:hypothetical protein [Lactobacillus sp.]
MEKLKSRLDAFSGAIIAIIITIMVLNLHTVLSDSPSAYLSLAKEIGIYLISFFYVANMWYAHATAFDEIDSMTYRIIILDFIFLAALSLMPLFTDMMAANTTRVTVMAYGLLSFVVNFLFRVLAQTIIHFEYTDKSDMAKVYIKIYGFNNRLQSILSISAIALALFKPTWAIIFYLAYPIWNFLSSSSDRQEMYDVEQLTPDQRADFLDFSTADRKAFRDQQEKITTMLKENADGTATAPESATTTETKTASSAPQSVASSASAVASQPSITPASQAQQPQPIKLNPKESPRKAQAKLRRHNYWLQWLDQSGNSKLQEQVQNGERLTQLQRQEWETWFKEQRKKDPHLQHQTQQARKQAQEQAKRQAQKQRQSKR